MTAARTAVALPPMPKPADLLIAAACGLSYVAWCDAGRPEPRLHGNAGRSRPDARAMIERVRQERGGFVGDSNPNWKGGLLELTCERCETSFSVKPCRGESARFCSLSCANEWQRETPPQRGKRRKAWVNVACRQCGSAFEVMPSRVEKKVFCSPSCNGLWRALNSSRRDNPAQRGNARRREDLANRYFRSSWEANYARYLNWLVQRREIASWDYECRTFEFTRIKRGTRTYTPDFQITQLDGSIYYVEIKGYMDQKSRTRHGRMKKYYPSVEVRLVERAEYRALARMFSSMLPGWEFIRA